MLTLILLVIVLCGNTSAAPNGRPNGSENSKAARSTDSRVKLWPKFVPYKFDGNFTSDELQLINDAFAEWKKYICVPFFPLLPLSPSYSDPYLSISLHDNKCSADLGYSDEVRTLNLARHCLQKRTVLRLLATVLGLTPEYNRLDRDKYIKVNIENITPSGKRHFKASASSYPTEGTGFDYHSITNVDPKEFSANGQDTIETIDPSMRSVIGTAPTLSVADVKKVGDLYSCASTCSPCPGEDEFVGGTCNCLDCSGPDVDSCQERVYCRDKLTTSQCQNIAGLNGCSKVIIQTLWCPVSCNYCTKTED